MVYAEKPKSKRYFKFYNMNKLVKKSMLVVAVAASLTSCSTYQHSYRSIEVDQKNSVTAKIQVDVVVTPDFSKRMKAQSTKNHKTPQGAKDEAYYNAIVENQIDVLISPIYSVTVRGGSCEATVHGYAGFYKVIPKEEESSASTGDAKKGGANGANGANGAAGAAGESKKAEADFDKKVEDLKKLGQFTKPIIILNTRNYYEHFIKLMDQAILENFMSNDHQVLWKLVNHPSEVVPAILNTPPWDKGLNDARV